MNSSPSRPAPAGAALAVWACAMAAYICAIAGRTSLGVAGVEAMARFDMPAATLALFSSVQVGVYGMAQIPVGLALDRWGPRRMLGTGALLVALAQVAMALAQDIPSALAARVLLGVGDATAFVSVLRLIPSWFTPFRIPLLTQLTSIFGLLGQVISAVPFMGVLHRFGWGTAFGVMAGLSFAAALVVLTLVRDAPSPAVAGIDEGAPAVPAVPASPTVRPTSSEPSPGGSPQREPLGTTLREVLGSPSAWLGFFTHWSGAGPAMTFTLLWGVPFMTLGMGMEKSSAAGVLVVFTAANIALGPVFGHLTARRPTWRVPGVVFCAVLAALAWVAVLAPSAPPAPWTAVVLAVVLSAAGVSSSIGFEIVRDGTARHRLGTAIGTTNMGGFTATLLAVQGIGWALDRVSTGRDYVWADFRVAMALQGVTWMIGVVGVLLCAWAVSRRRAGRTS
ncbi:MAG: MFS transporter [Pauljensenia sp.]